MPATAPDQSKALPAKAGRWALRARFSAAPRWLRLAATIAALACAIPAAGMGAIAIAGMRLGPLPLDDVDTLSVTVLDREDRLLRAFTTKDGRWRLPLDPADVDPKYLEILLAFEDKRFYEHGGVDYLALLRAGLLLARHGRILSGGSTLTMQVARLLEGRHERTGAGKLRQIARALQLERQFSKTEILRLYLRLAPMGGNIEGVRAAALAYFGKEPRHLSVGEAALLVALPQSPETRRPDRNSEAARRARNRVLDRAVAAGVLKPGEAERAKGERIPAERLRFPKLAPHRSHAEVTATPSTLVHRLTIDRDVQVALEALAAEQTKLLGQKLSAAIMAVDHTTGEILAEVGSAGYFDRGRLGAIDMTEAIRSPGSALKPFIYGLAFDAGIIHPETLIEDRPTRFGTYAPANFDDEFHGTVTIREALGNSLNVPAVKVLHAVGPGKLIGRFRRAGISPVLPAGTAPSLAIALGGLGMTMKDLVALYAALANGGEPVSLACRRDNGRTTALSNMHDAVKRRLMSPVAAWYVSDILRDAPPPPGMKGGSIAYKTGTSYGYRDAWAVGYDGRHVVAVWVGRPDGTSTPGLMGRTAAAPILFDAFRRIAERRTPLRQPPSGVMRVTGAALPPPLKRFRDERDDVAAGPFLEPPVLISFPPDRSELDIEAREDEPLVLKAEGGTLPLTWLVDGKPVASESHRHEVTWQPRGRGFVKLSVIDAKGRADRVTVRLR